MMVRWAPVLVPAVAAVLCSLTVLPNGFVYDDAFILGEIPAWKLRWLEAFFDTGDHWYAGRILTYATIGLDHTLWGTWAPGFRLTSVALHAVASGAAGWCIARLAGSRAAGVFGGLLFAVHPVHAEAVAQLINRKDVLATLFILPSLVLWLDPRRRPATWLASLGFLGLAFLSKEIVAAGFVPMLLLADLLLRDDPPARRLRLAALRFAPFALGGLVVAALAFDRIPGAFAPERMYDKTEGAFGTYAEVLRASIAAIPDQLRLLLVPVTLSADYPPPHTTGWTDPRLLLGATLLVAWVGAALAAVRRNPLIAFGILWVPVVYLPCSNVLPLVQFFVAERYLYAPSFGVCLLGGTAFATLWARVQPVPARRYATLGLAALLIVASGTRTAVRHRDWRSGEALARASIDAGVETWRMHHMLGIVHLGDGKSREAEALLRRSAEIGPTIALVLYDLATALVKQGRVNEARETVVRAEAMRQSGKLVAPSRMRLARALLARDRPEHAAHEFVAVLALEPSNPQALLGLAWLRAASTRAWVRNGSEAQTLAASAARSLPEVWRPLAVLADAAARAELGEPGTTPASLAAARASLARAGNRRRTAVVDALLRQLRAGQPPQLRAREILSLLPG